MAWLQRLWLRMLLIDTPGDTAFGGFDSPELRSVEALVWALALTALGVLLATGAYWLQAKTRLAALAGLLLGLIGFGGAGVLLSVGGLRLSSLGAGDVPAYIALGGGVLLLGVTVVGLALTGMLRWSVLHGLRISAFALVGFLIFHPFSCTAILKSERPRPVILLVDDSRSMTQRDRRVTRADQDRAARGLGLAPLQGEVAASWKEIAIDKPILDGDTMLTKVHRATNDLPPDSFVDLILSIDGKEIAHHEARIEAGKELNHDFRFALNQAGPNVKVFLRLKPSRAELVRGVLANRDLALEDKLAAVGPLRVYRFAGSPERLGDGPGLLLNKLRLNEERTALTDSLAQVVASGEGDPPAAVVLITDGGDNDSKKSLKEVAEECARRDVALHIYGVGAVEQGVLQLRDVNVPEIVFAKDDVEVPVSWRARGFGEKSTGLVEVVLYVNGKEVARHEEKARDGEDLRHLFKFIPPEGKNGERLEVKAVVRLKNGPEFADERTKQTRLLVDHKFKVLYIEGQPRWTFKHLMTALLRNPRVEASFLLTGVDESARVKVPPFLTVFPATRQELLAYDLIIIGDVSASVFDAERANWIAEFVTRHQGGLIFIAGRVHAPASWVGPEGLKPLLELLPVEVKPVRFPKLSEVRVDGWKPVLTPVGELTATFNLAGGGHEEKPQAGSLREENLQIWRALPDMHWFYPVTRLKPGAVVLLSHPTERLGDDMMPLAVLQSVGNGQVLYFGIEETWRWLFNKEDDKDFFARFWGQVIYRMALSRDDGDKQAQLMLDQPDPIKNRPSTVYARLFDADLNPLKKPEVKANLLTLPGPNGQGGADPRPIVLREVPGQEGLFQATLTNDHEGRYALEYVPQTGQKVRLDYQVTAPPNDEMAEIGLQEPPLADAAARTGGGFYREEDLQRLVEAIKPKTTPVEVRRTVLPWNWAALLAFVGLVSLEWLIRKFSNLS